MNRAHFLAVEKAERQRMWEWVALQEWSHWRLGSYLLWV
jgi:hypothetical protein